VQGKAEAGAEGILVCTGHSGLCQVGETVTERAGETFGDFGTGNACQIVEDGVEVFACAGRDF
jgi:hypothetical protein